MRDHGRSCLVIAGCAIVCGLALIPLARGDEIVAITDEHGNKIFINTGEPAARSKWGGLTKGKVRTSGASLPLQEINQLVEQTAGRHQVDPRLVNAIIQVESKYDPNAVSRKGAMGLMQLIPETARRFGIENPFDPKENIEGGVTYLKSLLDLYGGDLALSLAAYNAGEHAVERFGGIPSFHETRNYVQKVTGIYQQGLTQGETIIPVKTPRQWPIIRVVDEQGVVHYTNVE